MKQYNSLKNHLVTKQLYYVDGLGEIIDDMIDPLAKKITIAKNIGISIRTLGPIRSKSIVSEPSWRRLLSFFGSRSNALRRLCPENWGGNGSKAKKASSDKGTISSIKPDVQKRVVINSMLQTPVRIAMPQDAAPKTADMENNIEFITTQKRTIYRGQLGNYTLGESKATYSSSTDSFAAYDENGEEMFIKTLKYAPGATNVWKHRTLQKLHSRFALEFANRDRLVAVRGIAHVKDYGTGIQEQTGLPVPFIVQEFIPGLSLKDYLAKHFSRRNRFSGLPNAKLWFRFARQLLTIIGDVHKAGVVHGDIWADNTMVRDNEPVIVDFGESFLLDVQLSKTADESTAPSGRHPAPERTIAFGKWSRPADIYGLGWILFLLATGEGQRQPEPNNYTLKDSIFASLKHNNKRLLDQNEGIGDIIVQCLHYKIEDRPSHSDDLLRLLDIFEGVGVSSQEKTSSTLVNITHTISHDVEAVAAQKSIVFTRILEHDLLMFSRRIKDIFAGQFLSITGDRAEILYGLLNYIALLESGDAYFTITTPNLWSPSNLGVNGRFLRINKMLAKKGVRIKRLFLITEEDYLLPFFSDMIIAQKAVIEELGQPLSTQNPSFDGKGYYTGFKVITAGERSRIIKHGHHVGISVKGGEATSLIFQAREHDGGIRRIEIKKEDAADSVLKIMAKYFEGATPISQFIQE